MVHVSKFFRKDSKLVVSGTFFRTHKLVLYWWLRPENSKFEFTDPVFLTADFLDFKLIKAHRWVANMKSSTNLSKIIFLLEKNNNKHTRGGSSAALVTSKLVQAARLWLDL